MTKKEIDVIDYIKDMKKDLKEEISNVSKKFDNFDIKFEENKKQEKDEKCSMWQSIRKNERHIVRINTLMAVIGFLVTAGVSWKFYFK